MCIHDYCQVMCVRACVRACMRARARVRACLKFRPKYVFGGKARQQLRNGSKLSHLGGGGWQHGGRLV